MDVSPIIKIFDSLLTAGAAVGLTAAAFLVILAGYQYISAGGMSPDVVTLPRSLSGT